jgi:chromosome segregation ATPase
MAGVLAVTATTLSLVAVHNEHTATKWRQLDQAQAAISARAATQVAAANGNIGKLNAEVKTLNSQISSMQGQLSSVANQKEKAIDQTTVFRDLLAAAGQVANNLQACINATDQLDSDVNAAVGTGDVGVLPALEREASAVSATCAQAQQGNNALQAAIQSAS